MSSSRPAASCGRRSATNGGRSSPPSSTGRRCRLRRARRIASEVARGWWRGRGRGRGRGSRRCAVALWPQDESTLRGVGGADSTAPSELTTVPEPSPSVTEATIPTTTVPAPTDGRNRFVRWLIAVADVAPARRHVGSQPSDREPRPDGDDPRRSLRRVVGNVRADGVSERRCGATAGSDRDPGVAPTRCGC
jgi:hypothetical protein